MIATLLIGLLAILYGAIGLNVKHVSLHDFYVGLIIFGVVFILERIWPSVKTRFARRKASDQ